MRVVVHVLIMQGVGRGMMAVFCFDSDIVSQPRYGYHQRHEHLVLLLIIVMVEFIIVALEIR